MYNFAASKKKCCSFVASARTENMGRTHRKLSVHTAAAARNMKHEHM